MAAVVAVAAAACEATVSAPGDALAGDRGARTLASFEPGDFLEGVAVADDGSVYVCATFGTGDTVVTRVAPNERTTVAQLPAPCNLALRENGTLWANAGAPGRPSTLWLIDPASGEVVRAAELPTGAWANGVAALAGGDALIADSALGCVWRLRPPLFAPEIWLEHASLRADPAAPDLPAANGIEVAGGAVLVSNSSARRLVRIEIRADGSAGEVRDVAQGLAIDDFAVRTDGTVFATTHVANSVVRLDPGGEATDVLGPADGALGPSAADFGRTPGDEAFLYVVTDGNLFGRQVAGNGGPLVAPVLLRVPTSW
jgi:sugar lactone lactonase YvrE